MKSLSLLAHSFVDHNEASAFPLKDRRFRRASFEMVLAFHALEKIQAPLLKLQEDYDAQDIALICATSHGSLHATVDFLGGLSKSKRARPFVFQNSLHNSITGFLCQSFKLNGPSFTLSHSSLSGEDGLELSYDLIHSGFVKVCILVGVDSLIEDFKEILSAGLPQDALSQGAGALILGQAHAGKPSQLQFTKKSSSIPPKPQSYYDSNLMAEISKAASKKDHLLLRQAPHFKDQSLEIKISV